MVKPKKHLGQHFLRDDSVASNIVEALKPGEFKSVLEIGPGMGVLTKFLLPKKEFETWAIDIDTESIQYLKQHFPQLENRIIEGDFLQLDFGKIFQGPFAVIGNFPYNISSQILFRILDFKDSIPEMVGMFQKEVAERVTSAPKKKAYGILSVFLQAFYDCEYLFTVDEYLFDPPPKVKSGVIRIKRNNIKKLDCDEAFFKTVVKTAFNQRRKTLRNSLKPLIAGRELNLPFLEKRAEELSWQNFVELTQLLSN